MHDLSRVGQHFAGRLSFSLKEVGMLFVSLPVKSAGSASRRGAASNAALAARVFNSFVTVVKGGLPT